MRKALPSLHSRIWYLQTLVAGGLLVSCLLLLHQGTAAFPSSTGHIQLTYHAPNADPCAEWDRYGAEADDPPGCLRAKQLREIQKYRLSDAAGDLSQQNAGQLDHLERCAMMERDCPERPLIIVDYQHAERAERDAGFHGGEGVWSRVILEGMRRMGFAVITADGNLGSRQKTWPTLRALKSSVHAYFAEPRECFRCLSSPACVRPEDYNPPSDPKHGIAVDDPVGSIPAWRVFSFGYWGSRPKKYTASAQQAAGAAASAWGRGADDPEEVWSQHALGNKWEVVPYPYPDHWHIPLSVQQRCLSTAPVPDDQRRRAVLALSKESANFHLARLGSVIDWPYVVDKAAQAGIGIWSTAVEDSTKPLPVPEGITSLGTLSKLEYTQRIGAVRALLGIGAPELSPSPYEALCHGTPVVLRYHQFPEPHGWYEFSEPWFQHGPVMKLGPPYVYSYNYSDPDDMLVKLEKAVSSPVKPLILPEMTVSAVHEATEKHLMNDWEADYEAIKAKNGGLMPRYPDVMLESCFSKGGICRTFAD